MRAKEYLEQVEKIDRMISNKQAELEQWMAIATSSTAPMDGTDRVQTSTNQQKMAEAVNRYVDIQREIDTDIGKMMQIKSEVIRTIEQLPTLEYDVLHKIYVSNSKLTFISSDGSIGYTDDSDILWKTGNENFTKLTPLTIDLNDGALMVDGAYLPICLKSTGGGHYHFGLNGKNFFLTDSDGKSSPMNNTNQLVLELPDEG